MKLIFPRINSSDAGLYQCVYNSSTSLYSRGVFVKVFPRSKCVPGVGVRDGGSPDAELYQCAYNSSNSLYFKGACVRVLSRRKYPGVGGGEAMPVCIQQ